MAMRTRLSGDVPGEGPDLGGDGLEQAGLAHLFLEAGAGDRGEGCPRAKEGGLRGPPRRAIFGESTARDEGGHVGVIREGPAPGMQDACKPRKLCAAETRVVGEAFEGESRGVEQGLGGEVRRRAEKGA
jgi:hypothetical protein